MKPPSAVKASSSAVVVSPMLVGLRYNFKVSVQYRDKTLEFISNLSMGNNIKQRQNKARESYVKSNICVRAGQY